MKHSESTSRTRQAFAASLKKLASIQPLSKVTVSALLDDTGFNRNTFYYHFRDIYDLLHWTLEQEASVVHGAALADPYSACTVADKALNGDERCSCFWDHTPGVRSFFIMTGGEIVLSERMLIVNNER